jgi:branched-chain amino acid transport system permease protein
MYGQTIINSLVSASSYILVGVSFYVTFSVARFYHFTHGAFFALGAYATYSLVAHAKVPLVAAAAVAMLAMGALATITDRFIYRRIRRSRGGPFIPLLASLGLYTVIQNIISMCYGDSALILPGSKEWGVFDVPGGRLTAAQTGQFVVAMGVVVASWFLMKRTLLGRRMRAVGQDIELSFALGIPVDRLIGASFAVGYAMAAMAGVVAAANVDLTPTMGMRPMMMGMVAMIIGGNSLWGTVAGAVLLAVAQHVGVLWLSTQWQDAIAFILMLAVLLVRPTGIFGSVSRLR